MLTFVNDIIRDGQTHIFEFAHKKRTIHDSIVITNMTTIDYDCLKIDVIRHTKQPYRRERG